MIDLVAPRRPGEHIWLRYDDDHRGCQQCGLRLFRGPRGFIMVDYWGVPSGNLLHDGSGGFGACVPPAERAPAVLIDYTGDPDVYFGCERFMHAIQAPPAMAPGADGQLVLVSSVKPACGYAPRYWEIGPARHHEGWTWCAECFPDGVGARRRMGARQLEAPTSEAIERARPCPGHRSDPQRPGICRLCGAPCEARPRKRMSSPDPPRLGPGGSTRKRSRG